MLDGTPCYRRIVLKEKCLYKSSGEIFLEIIFFSKVINFGSDAFSNPIFQKVFKKLAIILDYKRPWMLCLALQPGQKLGIILPFEVVLELKLPKNHFNQKCAPKILLLNEKKIRKI